MKCLTTQINKGGVKRRLYLFGLLLTQDGLKPASYRIGNS